MVPTDTPIMEDMLLDTEVVMRITDMALDMVAWAAKVAAGSAALPVQREHAEQLPV